MTPVAELRDRLRALREKATRGPWRVHINPEDVPEECDIRICGDIFVVADISGPKYSHCEPNAALIAEAVNALPAIDAILTALIEPPMELIEAIAFDTMNARHPGSGNHAFEFVTQNWSDGLRDARAALAALAKAVG